MTHRATALNLKTIPEGARQWTLWRNGKGPEGWEDIVTNYREAMVAAEAYAAGHAILGHYVYVGSAPDEIVVACETCKRVTAPPE
jgi:hypothetical protein